MILFIANYPDQTCEKDGMMQRIAAVDRHFALHERIYLGISFFGNLRRRTEKPADNLSLHRVNFFIHLLLILRLGLSARGIYVHSIHNGFRALPLYLCRNVFTDLHGVFPEELGYYGKKTAAALYTLIEMIIVRNSRAIIVVTDAMADHYRAKYRGLRAAIHTIPIFDDFPVGRRSGRADSPHIPVAVYSGGTQKWQNVDLMLEAVGKVRYPLSVVILTPDVARCEEKVAQYGLTGGVHVRTVPKSEVYRHYTRADLGFILRDDSVVNRAACPTKLVEYLACGVIPVVLQPRIGDFDRRGYSSISLEQFISGNLPRQEELESMRKNNYRVVCDMREAAGQAMGRMADEFLAVRDHHDVVA